MYALKSQISVHKSIFREVFCHIYDKIPRHTGQNAITVGDLKMHFGQVLWTEWTATKSGCHNNILQQPGQNLIHFYIQLSKEIFSYKIAQHKNTKYDTIPAKSLEIMFLNISHQEFDGDNRNKKCNHNAGDQCKNLCRSECEAEFYQFQQTRSEHNRNCQKKGKFCCNRSWSTNKDTSNNRGTGTGCSRNNR